MNPHGNIKHGGHGTITYSRWKAMMQRCHDPKQPNYARYGGAGVKVCERWKDFVHFRADMGECADRSLTLDRIDGSKGYEQGNCRWVTKAEQSRNRPLHCVRLTHAGTTKNLSDWARDVGITPTALRGRLRIGWTVERALTTPQR